MSIAINWKNITKLVYAFVLKHKLHHLFFWLIYVIVCSIIIQPGRKPKDWIFFSSIILFFHALVAYINIGVLFNQLLLKRYYLTYALSLTLSILAVSFPIAIVFHKLVHHKAAQQFVWSTNFFLLNWASILLTTLIVLSLKLLFKWYKEEQLNKGLQKINIETELRFLKAQINPHFLFNALNNLYALTLIKSNDAPTVVLKLSNILRYVLYETTELKVALNKEVAYMQDYLDLEKIRQGDKLTINFEKIGNFNEYQIEPMLFLTFMENSFKHGIQPALTHTKLSIVLKAENSNISFSITNPYFPNVEKKESHVGGIGLANISKRLQISYPNKHTLELLQDKQNQLFTVILNINTNG